MDRKGKVKGYKDLDVWHAGIALATAIYRATEAMPKHELYGLTGQIRRAAASVPGNIAEGSARRHTKELLHFLSISLGSLREVETYLHLIRELMMLGDVSPLLEECEKVGRMITRLSQSLERRLA